MIIEPKQPPSFITAPPPRRPSLLRGLLVLLLLLAVAGGIGWIVWHPRQQQQQQQSRRGPIPGGGGPTPVVTATVRKGDLPISLNALGTVTPLATVTVRTQIAGQLINEGFQEGQLVKAGDFLAQIDPRPYQAQLDQYQGQLVRDQALLKNAQIDLARYRTLVAEDSIAHQQLDTQESLVAQYQGTVRTDQAQIDTAKLNLTYCRIVAPVSGRVGLRQVDPGNYVQTSDTNGIVVITQLQPITVIFNLPEDNLPAVQDRLHAGVSLPVSAFDRSQSIRLADGKLLTLDNQIDTSTGMLKLRALFDNKDERLFPNQFVTVQLLVNTLHDAALVPAAAIQRGTPGTFVYLVQAGTAAPAAPPVADAAPTTAPSQPAAPGNIVIVRKITLGPTSGDQVAVTAGLEPGDQVVVDGADRLRDGAPVRLPAAKPQNGDAAPAAAEPDKADPAKRDHRHRSQQ